MGPHNNDKGNSGADDFVVIDNPTPVAVEDVHSKTPIKGGYVKIKTKKQAEKEEALLHIEGFEPMLHSAFPDHIKQALLQAARHIKHRVRGKACSPHIVLIKNATAIFECFFYFSPLHNMIGRYNIFALVGKACGLIDDDSFVILQQYVGSVIQTLSDARYSSLRMGEGDDEGEAVPASAVEDSDIRELLMLVDRYMEFEADEPIEVNENWCDLEMVRDLFTGWQDTVNTGNLVFMDRITENASIPGTGVTGDDITDLLEATSLAAKKVQKTLQCLQVRRHRRELTPREELMVKKILKYATGLSFEVNESYSQDPPADMA